MDTSHWTHGDAFPVLDLVAQFEFKTPASVSFELGKSIDRHSPRLPEMEPGDAQLLESGSVFFVLGWLDVHHPCDGFHPLRLRVGLPDRYVSWESMQDLVPQIVTSMGLPPDVPYQVHLVGMSQQIYTEEPWPGFVDSSHGSQEAKPGGDSGPAAR